MISRYYWIENNRNPIYTVKSENRDDQIQGADNSGWLIVTFLTAGFGAWLIYRWLFQPGWLAILPAFLIELIDLAQMAAALTVLILWAGLLWRQRTGRTWQVVQVMSLDQLYTLSPKAFEHYVAGLFRQKGYRVIVRGRSGDHGVDLELIVPGGKRAIVQCKRYQKTVGEEIVRELFGTLVHERVARAFLVTTADISDAAYAWARGKPLTLIDGRTLVRIAGALAESSPPSYKAR